MDPVRTVVRRAARRLFLGRFFDALLAALAGGVVLAALALVAERAFAFGTPWRWVAIGLGAAAVIGSIAWAAWRRPREVEVAQRVDERGGLREALSTALYVERDGDSWSAATVDHARRMAQGVDVSRLFPARTPDRWWWPVASAALLVILILSVPQGDVMGWLAKRNEEKKQDAELQQAKTEVKAQEQELQEAIAKIDDDKLREAAGEAASPDKPQSAEDVKREAIRKLTSVQDRLKELRAGEKGQKLDAIARKMAQLKQPGPGPLEKATQALQRGDFRQAAEELQSLADRLASGEMSEPDRKTLEEQLKSLADQMKKLSEQRKEMEQALQDAGMDSALAGDPSALQKALEGMQSLTDAQKKQLMEMAQAAAQACEQCQGMGEKMAAAAQALQEGMAGAAGELGEMGEGLSEMEMLAEEMAQTEAAQNAVAQRLKSLGKGRGGNGQPGEFDMWQLWSQDGKGSGGTGGQRDSQDADFSTKAEKAPTATNKGPIIGTRLVQGDQVRGESRAEFEQVVEAGASAAAEAIENKAIPREDQDAVKRYFGRLAKKTEAKPVEDGGAPAPAPAPRSDAPAKDAPATGKG